MPTSAPGPVPPTTSIPDSPRARIRLALAIAARHVAERARALACTEGDRELQPGELVAAVRELRALDLVALDLAVAAERAAGATWPDLAAALRLPVDLTLARHEERVQRWVAGEPAPYGPALHDGSGPTGLPDPPTVTGADAEEMDRWYRATADPDDAVDVYPLPRCCGTPRVATDQPVSGGLF